MKVYLKGISYYLPETVLTNELLIEQFPDWTVEKVADKIGVKQRHIAGPDETAGDLAVKAAEKLFDQHAVSPETIDFILLCTQSPDYFLPTTACLLQDKLGIPTSAGALDFNLGCSGYVYGLSLAKGLICAGIAHNVLLLTSETYSKYLHPSDKSNRSIFGDGASASLVSTDGFAEIKDFVLGTDGRGADNLIIQSGCARQPLSSDSVDADESGQIRSSRHLYMNGSEVFNFTLESVPPLVEKTLLRNGLEKSDIDFFVFHQANKFMLNTIRKVCGISKEQFPIDMEDTGNTVSSTIPIVLSRMKESGALKDGQNILLAGFGVGYSWGACTLSTHNTDGLS